MPTTEEDISDSFDVDVLEDTDLGVLPDKQKLVACLLDAAAATSTKNHHDNKDADDDNEDAEDHNYDKGAHDETYFNARKWLEKNAPPIIDLTMIRGSDFSDDENKNNGSIPMTVKVKVEPIEEEETQWTALDA